MWAQKSRYAIAYTYEKFLSDKGLAIQSYQILANEYPKTEYGKVAKNKITKPVDEIKSDEKSPSSNLPEDNLVELDEELLEKEYSDYIPIDPSEIVDTDMLDTKRPAKTFYHGFDEIEKETTEKNKEKDIYKEKTNKLIKEKENLKNSQVEVDSIKIID